MEVFVSLLLGFGITLLAMAAAIFYVVVLVTRLAWLCQKIETLWKNRTQNQSTQPARIEMNHGTDTLSRR